MTLVEALDIFLIEALVSDLHPGAECSNCRKIFNHEADRLGSRRKTTADKPRTRRTFALSHKQFGRYPIVEGYDLFVQKRARRVFAPATVYHSCVTSFRPTVTDQRRVERQETFIWTCGGV